MTISVDSAQRQFEEAQAILDQAREAERFEAQFPEQTEIFLVIARKVEFQQFVSYSVDGIPLGSFTLKKDAEDYAAGIEKPVGTELVVEPLSLRVRRG